LANRVGVVDAEVGDGGRVWVRVPDVLWAEVETLVPVPARRFRSPGRRRFEERLCLEGILTVLRWGIPWRALPPERGRPSGKTCWRRLDEWQRAGVWERLVERLQARLADTDAIAWERAIADATIVPAKRGAPRSGKTLQTEGVPPASCTSPATGAASP
jgi:transposase